MERLDQDSLLPFVNGPGATVVLFGHPSGRTSLLQAHAFADVWAEQGNDVRFGYVDALALPAARESVLVRVLPTILLFRDGDLVETCEGFHSHRQLKAMLERRSHPTPDRPDAARRNAIRWEAGDLETEPLALAGH